MKAIIDEINLKAQGLKLEYNRQRNGSKQHNREVLRVKAEQLKEVIERLIVEVGR